MTDAEIAKRVKAGDREAARALIQRHYASVLRFLTTICRNTDDAEELAQDTFVRALNHIGKFRGASSLRTWIHRIAYYEFAHRRRQRIHASLNHELSSHPFEAASALALDLERALLALPDQARAAFVLCEIQELTIKEAATVLRVPEGTVKSRVHTARRQLRAALADEHEEVSHVTRT